MLPYTQIFNGLALFFDAVALLFVAFAGFEMLYSFLRGIKKKKTKKKMTKKAEDKMYHEVRRIFVHRIIHAIDFFLIADMVKLAFADSLTRLLEILVIVVIRTILSYFLLKETEYHK